MPLRVQCTILPILFLMCPVNPHENGDRISDITSLDANEIDPKDRAELIPGQAEAHDITSTGVTLTWLAPPAQLLVKPVAASIAGYRVKIQHAQTVRMETVNGSTHTSALITGLLPKTLYATSVITMTKDKQTFEGKKMSFKTRASVPARVAQPSTRSVTYRSLTLRWAAPNDNGDAIREYVLTQQVGGGGDYAPLVENGAVLEGTQTSATSRNITGLHPGTVYRFRVAAANRLGKGPDSVATIAVSTLKAKVPSAPIEVKTKLFTTRGLTLTWKAGDDCGSSIYAYRMYIQTKGEGPFVDYGDGDYGVANLVKTKGGFSLRIKNLKPATHYSFQIGAVNYKGLGQLSIPTKLAATKGTGVIVLASPSSTLVLPALPVLFYIVHVAVPEKPQQPAISNVGSSSLELRWDAPYDGGAPITGYRIAVQTGGAGGFVEQVADTKSNATSRKIHGLKYGGESYEFRIQAINDFGLSKPSPPSTVAITKEDRAAAATVAVKNEFAVRKIGEVRNQLLKQKEKTVEEAHKSTIAVEAARHEKGLKIQFEEEAKRCKIELAHQKRLFVRKTEAAKSTQIREVAVIQRLSDEKLEAEKQMCRKNALAQEETISELRETKQKLTEQTVILESKAEQLEARLVAMQMEGCKLGIKSWCAQ